VIGVLVAILSAVLGFVLAALIFVTLRLSELRERVSRVEEWVRVAERRQ
jgi:uncharacterized integral membrane protein